MSDQYREKCRIAKAIAMTGFVMSLGVGLASCQEAEAPKTSTSSTTIGGAPADAKQLKLGSLLPSTGDLASLGGPMIAAVPLLVETVNQCGGVNGAPIELVKADDQTDPAAGTEAMNRLEIGRAHV